MLKSTALYFILSILVVFFAKYAHVITAYIALAYTYCNYFLAPIFSAKPLFITLRQVIALVILPLIITGVPALIYQAIKHRNMPYFVESTWIVWLIIVLSKILIY